MQANFVDIYSQGMHDRSMQSGMVLAREIIKLTDWPMTGNLSNQSSGVQIQRDICTRLKHYLYSAKCSWIINVHIEFGVIFVVVCIYPGWRELLQKERSKENIVPFFSPLADALLNVSLMLGVILRKVAMVIRSAKESSMRS